MGLSPQSLGGPNLFRPECGASRAPSGCPECPAAIERNCPYSAIKLLREGRDLLYAMHDATPAGIETELREGPYGRCVYACGNDAVDHQIVTLLFEGGVTA